MTERVSGFEGLPHIPKKEPPARVATLRVGGDMSVKHHQRTRKRRKALLKKALGWVSALSTLLGLVKLVLDIAKMLHP